MGEWKEIPLGDLVKFSSGKTPNMSDPTLWGGSIPWISAKLMTDHKVKTSTVTITERGLELGSKLAQPSDILILVRGSGLFHDIPINWVERPVAFNQDIKSIRAYDPELQEYIYYWLKSSKDYIYSILDTTGIGAGKFDTDLLRGLVVTMPVDDSERQKLVEIASTLYAKIDLLHRQNKTLEAMAETLFRQWFVEEAEETWVEMRLDQFSTVGIGRTPPRKEQHWFSTDSADVKWISIKDMAAEGPFIFSTAEYLTEEAVERFRVPVIPKDTVVLSFKMTLGRVKITTEAMLSNEAIAHFRINADSYITKEFLYLGLKTYPYESLGTTSTIVDSINSGMIKGLVMQVPPVELMDRFMEQCGPWFEKIRSNQLQIQTLTSLRDTLLPKLMSGEVRVNESTTANA